MQTQIFIANMVAIIEHDKIKGEPSVCALEIVSSSKPLR